MITILFSDTHFGTRQNSLIWLDSQVSFIRNQLIPCIIKLKEENHEKIRIIHLGDVFDSRSTISTLVISKVIELFKEIKSISDEFIIVSGNHDYYSPTTDKINNIKILLEFIGITIIYNDCFINEQENELFIPWFEYYKTEKIKTIIKKYNIKTIFTHADIVTNQPLYKNIIIYSGHMHIPFIKGNIRNIGSCYALDFGDSNSYRGFYILKNNELFFNRNNFSLKFIRLYNEDIFKYSNYNKNDYIEIYILEDNLNDKKYKTKINEILKLYKNTKIIPQISDKDNPNNIEFKKYDIENIIKDFIPINLQNKFNILNNKLKEIK